ncbi:hypothetical protein RN001_011234 [Aquatica leii]|uniref:Nicastrin n=1 Tax=Aquatica leii TaxID=1421715 RepID=A0AAN7SNN2_9COLE|nr:hypothetical protein RN001_011234 [Aquatica leii]
MNLKSLISVILILKLSLLNTGLSERAKDQMYEHFDGRMSCFRRLNGTHQIGCSSKKGGSTGIIHFVETEDNLNFIIKNGADTNYIPIIPMQLLTQKTMHLLKNANIFSGLILYKDNETLEHFTHERTCPNKLSNMKNTCDVAWNPNGTGLLYEDLPFPIYYLNNNEDLQKMRDCFETFNNYSYETHKARSLCLVELDAFMFATIDTPTCIRRSNLKTNLNPVKFCDPLGGENVWATLFPLEKKQMNYVVVAARLDTTSLFHGVFPGAVSPITGIVTLLTVADYLKRMVGDDENYEKNVLFALFNGESYDYIGSQRMVYDMSRGDFPVKYEADAKNPVPTIDLTDISLFVELSHLSKSGEIFLHSLDKSNTFYDVLKKHSFTKITEVVGRLPPASAQTFIKAQPNISAVVLGNYQDEYTNQFYNSINDNASNIDYYYYNATEIPLDSIQHFTANIAEMLAKSLYVEISGKDYKGDEKVRLDLVDELYNCYLLDADCKVHQAVQRKKLRESPYNSYSLYVGVTVVPNLLTYAIGLTLAWLTGTVTSNSTCVNEPASPMYQYFNMSKSLDNLNTTVCYRSIMNFTEAISPAFLIDDYDWKSGKYSSWSESTWKDFNVRMFLRPSPAHERFTLAIGSITMVMSIIIVYFIKSRSDVLFSTVETCSPTSC